MKVDILFQYILMKMWKIIVKAKGGMESAETVGLFFNAKIPIMRMWKMTTANTILKKWQFNLDYIMYVHKHIWGDTNILILGKKNKKKWFSVKKVLLSVQLSLCTKTIFFRTIWSRNQRYRRSHNDLRLILVLYDDQTDNVNDVILHNYNSFKLILIQLVPVFFLDTDWLT